MSRGGPDFGAVAARVLTAPVLDLGELAVRLGGPSVYDRLGAVIGLFTADAPAGGLSLTTSGTGRIDSFVSYSPLGPYVWRLQAPALNDVAAMTFRLPFLGDAPAGIEVVWKMPGDDIDRFQLQLDVGTGSARAQTFFQWEGSDADWMFFNSSGTFVDSSIQPADPRLSGWHSLKLVADPADQTYIRVVADGEEAGMAGIAGSAALPATRQIDGAVRLLGDGTATTEVEVAAVIVTVNEPGG